MPYGLDYENETSMDNPWRSLTNQWFTIRHACVGCLAGDASHLLAVGRHNHPGDPHLALHAGEPR